MEIGADVNAVDTNGDAALGIIELAKLLVAR